MRRKFTALIPALAAVAAIAGTAIAQDTGGEITFENAIDPDAIGTMTDVSLALSASDALFQGWQVAYQIHQDAIESGVTGTELAALAAASDAAGAAYEASLVADNTVMLSAGGMEPLSDEAVAALFE